MTKNVMIAILLVIILMLLFLLLKSKMKETGLSIQLTEEFTKKHITGNEDPDSLNLAIESILVNKILLDSYVEKAMLAPPWRYINADSANCFYKIYHDRKEILSKSTDPKVKDLDYKLDKTEAVFIPLDTFLDRVLAHYINDIDLTKPDTWKGKGYLVYPVHYGKNGHKKGNKIINQNMSSVIIQFVQEESPELGWDTKDKSTYNFGGLKPPKKFLATADLLNGNVSDTNITCN